MPSTRCAIYARVSSEEQASEGKTSIDTQLADCRALAAKLGWLVVGEYVDDRRYRVGRHMVEPSGTRADRPQWRRMLDDLAAGRANAVVSWMSSRLYRGYRPMADFLEVIDSRPIAVQLVKEQFNKDFAIFGAWQAKRENEVRVERTRFGHIGRARRGLPATHASPFFRKIVDPDTGEKLGYEFDEQYRALFDTLARLLLQRVSYRDIALRLGPSPLSGKPWRHASIIDIMTNPFFRGLIVFGRRNKNEPASFAVPARHRPVWDAATCAAIEIEVTRRQHIGGHGPRSKTTPFAGVLRCGYCGWAMSATRPRESLNAAGRTYRYYNCHRNHLVRRGYEPGTAHPTNGIGEPKLLALLRAEVAAVERDDLDAVAMLLASQAPTNRVDDTLTRGKLADARAALAEMEPELARVRTPGARAAIEAELGKLRDAAALYEGYLASRGAGATIDVDDVLAALRELKDCPELLDQPDAPLKLFVARCFPVIYIRDGAIVPGVLR